MKNLLYIGNNLTSSKTNITSIQRLGNLLQGEGFKLRYASNFNNKFLRLIHMCWSCVVKSKWADFVLIDTYSTKNFWYAYFCSQLCRITTVPYIPILHGGNLPERLKSNPILCKAIFNNSYKNVAPSLYLKNEFLKRGIENVVYIPNAFQINDYEFSERDFSTLKLFWLRAFTSIYNPKMAIRVLERLVSLGYNAQLCMVGPDVDGSSELVSTHAKSYNLDVTITGKLKKQDWIELSKSQNFFINTSNYDNMPVSVIEAMALGLPIISTNVGGLPYLIEKGKDGLLVEKDDSDAMADAIIRLFSNAGLRQNIINNARLKAETFDWHIIKKDWLFILKHI